MAKKDSVPVRMLTGVTVDGVSYSGNQLVGFTPEQAKQQVAAGVADDAKEAVAYLIEEGAVLIEHAPAAAEEGQE